VVHAAVHGRPAAATRRRAGRFTNVPKAAWKSEKVGETDGDGGRWHIVPKNSVAGQLPIHEPSLFEPAIVRRSTLPFGRCMSDAHYGMDIT
jgi:hypothetical protein